MRSCRKRGAFVCTHRQRRLNVESLESRLLLVVVTQASNPTDHLTDASEFTGVGKIVYSPIDPGTVCTATLLPSGRHVLTAGHCVAGMFPNETWYIGFVTDPVPVPPTFQLFPFTNTNNPVTSDVFIHSNFIQNGFDVKLGYDVAIIDLDQLLPPSVTRYGIFRGNNELSLAITEIVGYGDTGYGGFGELQTDNLKRDGKNKFEATGEELNGHGNIPLNFIAPEFGQLAYDFDNGDVGPCHTMQHATCDAMGFYLTRNNLGLGADEVFIGDGDSGGPSFLDGKIAGVSSWRITDFLTTDIDITDAASNYGEIGFAMRVSTLQSWIDGFLAPQVQSVTIGSSNPQNYHPDYLMPSGYSATGPPNCSGTACNVKALQLQTVPVGNPNQISITFTEPMNGLVQNNLQVYGRKNNVTYPVSAFTYNAATLTGTWTFSPILGDQVEFTLSNARDTSGVLLDAEWTNPPNTTASNGSKFPSGNGSPDGTNTFVFDVTVASADFNRDNFVDGADFGIWNIYKNNTMAWTAVGAFAKGDANGNLFTDGSDFNIWNALKFTSYTWSGSQQGLQGGGGTLNTPSASWLAAYEELLIRHRIYVNGRINQSLSNSDWARFGDELMILLGRL